MKSEPSNRVTVSEPNGAGKCGWSHVAASAGAWLAVLHGHWPLATGGGERSMGDNRLPALALVYEGALRRRVLAAALRVPARRVGGGGAEMLAGPIKGRGLARFRFGASRGSLPASVIAHMYEGSSRRGAEAFAIMKKLRRHGFDCNGGEGRIARPMVHVHRWRLTVREDAAGTALGGLADEKQAEGAAAIGRLLARLHRAPLRLASAAAPPHASGLETLVALAVEVMPYQLAAIAGAHADVRRDLAAMPGYETRLIHGDFQPRHLLIDGGNAVLLDCDGVGHGDPARDIGTFLAHLRLLSHSGGELWPDSELAFLAAYGALTPGLESRVIAYLKAELLTLACQCAFSTRERNLVRPLLSYVGDDVPVLAG